MDSVSGRLDRVRLDSEKLASCQRTMDLKVNTTEGKNGIERKIVVFCFGKDRLLSVVFTYCPNGEYRVTSFTFEASKMLDGHNGGLLLTEEMWQLALTRVLHLLRLITRDMDSTRLLPGLGENNRGYWNSVDVPVHVNDDGQILRRSHGFHLPRSKKPPLVVAGESTTIRSRYEGITFYDKGKKEHQESSEDAGICLRIEVRFKAPWTFAAGVTDSIAKDVVVTSFTLRDALAAHKKLVERLLPDSSEYQPHSGRSKVGAFIAWLSVGREMSANRLVEGYLSLLGTEGRKTAQRLRKAVSDLLGAPVRSALLALPDLEALKDSPVVGNRRLEIQFKRWVVTAGLPIIPDPAISAAYSHTVVIWGKPTRAELLGTPVDMPPANFAHSIDS